MTECVVCPKKPQQCDHGKYACFSCLNRVLQHLSEIEEYTHTLTAVKGKGAPGRRAPGFGSGSPARDDVIVALDYRSHAGASVHRLRDPRDESDTPVRSILGSLHGITEWVRALRGTVHRGPVTVSGEVRFLRVNLDWCAEQLSEPDLDGNRFPWIGDLVDDIRELHSTVRRLSPLSGGKPKMIGRCPTPHGDSYCGTKLFATEDASEVRCPGCHEPWPRTKWLWLGMLMDDAG